jgi:hypothetical protein
MVCVLCSHKRPSHRSQVIPYQLTSATLPLASRLFPHQKFLEPPAKQVTVCRALLKMWRLLQPCATWRSCTALSSPNRHGNQKPGVRHPSSRSHRRPQGSQQNVIRCPSCTHEASSQKDLIITNEHNSFLPQQWTIASIFRVRIRPQPRPTPRLACRQI